MLAHRNPQLVHNMKRAIKNMSISYSNNFFNSWTVAWSTFAIGSMRMFNAFRREIQISVTSRAKLTTLPRECGQRFNYVLKLALPATTSVFGRVVIQEYTTAVRRIAVYPHVK